MAQRARYYGAVTEDHCGLDAVTESKTDCLCEEPAGRQSLLSDATQVVSSAK